MAAVPCQPGVRPVLGPSVEVAAVDDDKRALAHKRQELAATWERALEDAWQMAGCEIEAPDG
uniref:Uncharacterized protein n=1 Tax=Romanomermis culicivorax TaxID=13658 RepID=A0A915L9B3_ROMCU